MKRLIDTYTIVVKDCFVGLQYIDLKVTGHVYIKHRKFLWWKLKPRIYIKIYVPYINRPYYDGEYNTNDKLNCAKVQLKAILREHIDKLQRKLDRYYDRQRTNKESSRN